MQETSDSTVYWLMRLVPEKSALAAETIDHLARSPSVVGYSDNEGDAECSKNALRAVFFEQMNMGDRIVVLQGTNEVWALVEIIGEAVEKAASEKGEYFGFKYSRGVSIVHVFELPFRTIAHAEGAPIIAGNRDQKVQLLVKEVLEAVSGDGFTVDWSPLVNHY